MDAAFAVLSRYFATPSPFKRAVHQLNSGVPATGKMRWWFSGFPSSSAPLNQLGPKFSEEAGRMVLQVGNREPAIWSRWVIIGASERGRLANQRRHFSGAEARRGWQTRPLTITGLEQGIPSLSAVHFGIRACFEAKHVASSHHPVASKFVHQQQIFKRRSDVCKRRYWDYKVGTRIPPCFSKTTVQSLS